MVPEWKKNIEMRLRNVRDLTRINYISLPQTQIKSQIADILTKLLPIKDFSTMMKLLMVQMID